MLDLGYFKTHIQEELDGEADYRAKAEECPEMQGAFNEMADQEHKHAEMLMKMLKKHAEDSEELFKHFSSVFKQI